MTRNVLIVAINLLIAAIIGGNAAFALIGGCDFGGRCTGSSGPLTWALAIGLPLLVAGAAAMLGYRWMQSRRNADDGRISISIPMRRSAEQADDAVDTQADDVMTARLARTTSAAHTAEAALRVEETEAAEPDAPAVEDVDEAWQDGADTVDDVDMPVQSPRWSLDKHIADADDEPMPAMPPADAFPAIAPFRPLAFAAMDDLGTPDEADSEEGPIDWLLDPDSLGDAPQLRAGSGFPWVVAGIDHICVGMARLGHELAGTDYPSEAFAWRQVVVNLPRHRPLAIDDSTAFIGWLNDLLDLTGPAGLELIQDALHELAVEAASDGTLAEHLPDDLVATAPRQEPRRMRFG